MLMNKDIYILGPRQFVLYFIMSMFELIIYVVLVFQILGVTSETIMLLSNVLLGHQDCTCLQTE
jgi:hypothetical protein